MSEEQNSGQEAGGEQHPEWKPPATQEEFNAIITKRIERERAKFADYDTLREKAAKFDEVEQANKTELEKERERAEAAERRAQEFELAALKSRIAVEEGVIPEVLTGSTEEEMRASAQKVKEWAEQGVRKAPPPPKLLKSGSAGGGDGALTGKERAAAALRQMRGSR